MPGIIKSDNGSISADQWAVAIADHIWPVDPATDGVRLMAARKAQNAIVDMLVPKFQEVIDRENQLLSANMSRVSADFDPDDTINATMSELRSILAGTPWEQKPDDPEWDRIMRGELSRQFNTAQHIERQWYCRRNPAPETNAFLAQHNLSR